MKEENKETILEKSRHVVELHIKTPTIIYHHAM